MIDANGLKNKKVVVTGGATGIGFAIANHFAKHGATVVIGSRRETAIADAIARSGGAIVGHPVDVADRPALSRFLIGSRRTWVKSTYWSTRPV